MGEAVLRPQLAQSMALGYKGASLACTLQNSSPRYVQVKTVLVGLKMCLLSDSYQSFTLSPNLIAASTNERTKAATSGSAVLVIVLGSEASLSSSTRR